MPEVALYIAASIDGYIARADGRIDWLRPYEADDYGYAEFYGSVQALIMGRKTYEQAAAFSEWPYPGKPAYVYTRGRHTAPRPDVVFTGESPVTLLTRLYAQDVRRVWLVGGSELIGTFRALRLINEYFVFVVPVLLGDGIPLFAAGPQQALSLVETRSYPSSLALLRYRPKERAA